MYTLLFQIVLSIMALILILEDNAADRDKAVTTAKSVGIVDVQSLAFASNAQLYLEKALRGEVPMPDVMLIDLDLGSESGFDLLQFWHRTSRLKAIPVIVWSIMNMRELCTLFGIHRFVSKSADSHVLIEAVASSLPNRSE